MSTDVEIPLEPGLAGFYWRHEDAEVFPSGPILTLIQLKFKPEHDLTDQGQPAGRIWSAVVEYLSTGPDCTAFYLGPVVEESNTVLLLLQLKNGKAWQNFQESLGITLVLGLLARKPFNRCLQVDVHGLGGSGKILEAISFTFQSDITRASKTHFEGLWNKLTEVRTSFGQLAVRGGWLEPDVPRYGTSAAQTAADTQPVIFVGLLFWDKEEHDKLPSELNYDAWKALGADLAAAADLGSSKATVQLLEVTCHNKVAARLPPAAGQQPPADRAASLFSAVPARQRRNDTGMWRNLDLRSQASIVEAQGQVGKYPEPAGDYIRMGEVNEYHMPTPLRHVSRPSHLQRALVVDVIWLCFTAGALNTAQPSHGAAKAFLDLRLSIGGQEECDTVLWGHDEEESDTVVMFILWKEPSSRLRAQLLSRSPSELCASLSPWLARAPEKLESFPLEVSLASERHLELIHFDVPVHHIDKTFFEQSYFNFQLTTRIRSSPAGIPTACRPIFGGWQEKPLSHTGSNEQYFRYTGLFSWENGAARKQWYQAFEQGMALSYERLGHIVDVLSPLATGGVESRLVEMQSEDLELMRRGSWLESRDLGAFEPVR